MTFSVTITENDAEEVKIWTKIDIEAVEARAHNLLQGDTSRELHKASGGSSPS